MENEAIKVTPCCKTRHWWPVHRTDLPDGIIRCELCDKLHDFEALLLVVRSRNPLTFMCDKCCKSDLEELVNNE